jgi:hypothetical protein
MLAQQQFAQVCPSVVAWIGAIQRRLTFEYGNFQYAVPWEERVQRVQLTVMPHIELMPVASLMFGGVRRSSRSRGGSTDRIARKRPLPNVPNAKSEHPFGNDEIKVRLRFD